MLKDFKKGTSFFLIFLLILNNCGGQNPLSRRGGPTQQKDTLEANTSQSVDKPNPDLPSSTVDNTGENPDSATPEAKQQALHKVVSDIGSILFNIAFFVTFTHVLSSMMNPLIHKILGEESSSLKPVKFAPDKQVTFKDIGGLEEVIADLRPLVESFNNRARFQEFGAKLPKGVLFAGPTGVGKTLLANALANEIKGDFYSISPAQIISKYLGESEKRMKEILEKLAERHEKTGRLQVLLFDEAEGLFPVRKPNAESGDSARNAVVAVALQYIDGIKSCPGVVIILATNHPDFIDPAIRRPGRIDMTVTFTLPDLAGREEILNINKSRFKLAPNLDLHWVAQMTPDFSGAELVNCLQYAAQLASSDPEAQHIEMSHILQAIQNKQFGLPRPIALTEKEGLDAVFANKTGKALIAHIFKMFEGTDLMARAGILNHVQMTLAQKSADLLSSEDLIRKALILLAGSVSEGVTLGTAKLSQLSKKDLEEVKKILVQLVSSGRGPEHAHLILSPNVAENVVVQLNALLVQELEKLFNTLKSHANGSVVDSLKKTLSQKGSLTPDDVENILHKMPEIKSILEKFATLKFVNRQPQPSGGFGFQ